MRRILRGSFTKIVALIYTAGALFHVARVTFRLGWQDFPFLPDWILVIAGFWGATGLIVFAREIEYRGTWEIITHWLIVFHLLVSVGLHVWILAVWSHEILRVFSIEYSYFGFVYFAFFAWRSWTMRLSPPVAPPASRKA